MIKKELSKFVDEINNTSRNSVLIGELSSILTQNGYIIGQNELFKWLRNNGYLIKRGERKNMPTKYSLDLKLFEIKSVFVYSSNKIAKTPKCTVKGQKYFIKKFCK